MVRRPDFKKRHEFYPATQTFKRKKADGSEETIEGFEGALGSGETILETDTTFAKVVDLNGDGWPDILIVGQEPGHVLAVNGPVTRTASWYENPGKERLAQGALWKRHVVAEEVDNQSVDFVDLLVMAGRC